MCIRDSPCRNLYSYTQERWTGEWTVKQQRGALLDALSSIPAKHSCCTFQWTGYSPGRHYYGWYRWNLIRLLIRFITENISCSYDRRWQHIPSRILKSKRDSDFICLNLVFTLHMINCYAKSQRHRNLPERKYRLFSVLFSYFQASIRADFQCFCLSDRSCLLYTSPSPRD